MRQAAAAVLSAAVVGLLALWWSVSTGRADSERREAGWITVTIGGGGVPAELPQPVSAPGPRPLFEPREAMDVPPGAADPQPAREPIRWIVREGDTLGELCQRFYNTAVPAVLQAVADFNGLDSVDAIREGQPLRFPPREALQHTGGGL